MVREIGTTPTKIGILELHYHSIFLYTMARVCKTKNTQVTIFTTREIYKLIEPHLKEKKQDYTIILKEEKESTNKYLKKVQKHCSEQIDILFINTIQETLKDLPHYLTFKPRCKMILTIHNANSWLKQKYKPSALIKPIRMIDSILSTILIKKIILKKFDAINVVYPPIKEYIQKNTNYKKEIYTIPFTFYDPEKTHKTNKDNTIKFVVPGAIEKSRRDYETIIEAFNEILPEYKDKIKLYILGRPVGSYGLNIIKKLKKLKEQNYPIYYFEEFVPESTYDEILSESDIIISPIKLKTKGIGEIEETYGLTKGTSSPFEAIQHAKPLIVPKNFIVSSELNSSLIRYENRDDLKRQLLNIITSYDKIETLHKEAIKNSNNFSLYNLQQYFEYKILRENKIY